MDAIKEWTQAQRRVIELTRLLSAEQAERQVPACPDWTVTQLLAHMVGLNADVLAGDEPEDHNAAWTQRQVDVRAGRYVAALTAECEGLTEAMRSWMGAQQPAVQRRNHPRAGPARRRQPTWRAGYGRPGGDPGPDGEAVRGLGCGRQAGARLAVEPGLGVRHRRGRARAGAVRAGLRPGRALMSRRTAAQLREWTTGGDIEEYLPLFSGLGPLPDRPLPE